LINLFPIFMWRIHHHDDPNAFHYPIFCYIMPKFLIDDDERIIRQGPGRLKVPSTEPSRTSLFPGEYDYCLRQGVIALTNKRFIFYLAFNHYLSEEQKLEINIPLKYITGTEHQGLFGYSVLFLETD